jgi:hypothetical protein
MRETIVIEAKQYEGYDDCLQAAVDDYIDEHPEATGYDLSPRWAGGEDGERESILLDVPTDMEDTSIFDGVVEFKAHGARYRAMAEGAAWGIYESHDGAFIRVSTIRRKKSDTPADIYERFIEDE